MIISRGLVRLILVMAIVAGINNITLAETAWAGGGAGKGEAGQSEFVELSPLVLPIIDASGLSQSVSLVVAIEVGNSSDAKKVEHIAPRLQDAFIQDMYGALSKEASLNSGGAIEVKMLKERLKVISQKVAGNMVEDVLLQVVAQNPF